MALLGDNLKGALSKAKEVVSNTVQQTTAQAKDYQEKRNQAKAPIEGAIARYEVTYIGGLPEYPKKKQVQSDLIFFRHVLY